MPCMWPKRTWNTSGYLTICPFLGRSQEMVRGKRVQVTSLSSASGMWGYSKIRWYTVWEVLFWGLCSISPFATKRKPLFAICIQEHLFGWATVRGVDDAACQALIIRSSKYVVICLMYMRLGTRGALKDFHSLKYLSHTYREYDRYGQPLHLTFRRDWWYNLGFL